ncbi:MAG: hypothetical protein LBM00_03270 [Deltaproteobacteria bacterium]|jgi:hypothetical protein|nr:hypothetical protein [Deltaproteobacteria bacterium]
MNAVSTLESMGLRVSLNKSGGLSLAGLQTLSVDDRQVALALARENKASILEELRHPASTADDPTPEQIAHARRMLVDCPTAEGKLHCWHCSRCDRARRCTAWRIRRNDVEFFRQSEAPYSLFLVESDTSEVLQ